MSDEVTEPSDHDEAGLMDEDADETVDEEDEDEEEAEDSGFWAFFDEVETEFDDWMRDERMKYSEKVFEGIQKRMGLVEKGVRIFLSLEI